MEFNFDSSGLMKIMSMFQNRKNIDDTNGNIEFRKLTDIEINYIFRNSTLMQRIVKKYPMEGKTIGYQLIDSKGNNITDIDEYDLLLEAFKEASIYSRLYSKCYLYIDYNDSLNDESPIKIGSKIQSFKIYFDLYKEGDFYKLNNESIYHTRIIPFVSNKTYMKDINDINDDNYADSIIQGIYNAYNDYQETNINAKFILRNLSYLSVGIDNLGAMSKSEEGRGMIFDRLFTLNMTRSINRVLAFDKKTEAISFISQTLSGVKEIIEELKEILVSESDYPIEEIFDQSPKQKLGSGVQNQLIARYLWARRTRLWVINNWMLYYKHYFNNTRNMQNIKIDIPFKVDLTMEEKANIEEIASKRNKNLIDAGVVVPEETRIGYKGDEFSLNIELDDSIYEKTKSNKNSKKEALGLSSLIQTPVTQNIKEENKNNIDAIPDDSFWDMLSSVTASDIDEIAKEILNV